MKDFILAVLGSQKQLTYRRLFVFVMGCMFLAVGQISEWAWLTLAGLFIGGETWERIAKNGNSQIPSAP